MNEKKHPLKVFRHRGTTAEMLSQKQICARLSKEITAALDQQVWHSPIGQQNDPYDTNPNFVHSSGKEIKDFIKGFRKRFGTYAGFHFDDLRDQAQKQGVPISRVRKALEDPKQIRKATKKGFYEGVKSAPICCFTEVPNNILMWSYYSSGHAGFSYVFSVASENACYAPAAIADVRYLSKRPTVTTVDMLRRMAMQRDKRHYEEDKETRDRVDNASLLCKADIWRHEREWRSLRPPNSKVGYHSIYPYELTGVIFGVNSETKLIDFVSEQVGEFVSKYMCKLQPKEYGLEIVELS